MLALKSVLFALLIPGTVTVLIPYVLIWRRLTTVRRWRPSRRCPRLRGSRAWLGN